MKILILVDKIKEYFEVLKKNIKKTKKFIFNIDSLIIKKPAFEAAK